MTQPLPSDSTPTYIPIRTENRRSDKFLQECSQQYYCDSQKVEATQKLTEKQMQHIIYNEVLFSHKES